MSDAFDPALPAPGSSGRRALLAGIGGIAAGGLLLSSRAQAGPLAPPAGAPMPTSKPLGELEPRVAVNDANTPTDGFAAHLISQPGSYYLTSNIAVGLEKAGVLIDASNVTLDLNGFSIIGAGSSSSAAGVAVASERADVLVHNGFIAECRSAVYGEESAGRVVVRNVHVRDTQFEAIFLNSQCIVEDCTVIDGGGISLGEGCRVSRCVVQAGAYFGVGTGARSVVEHCQVSGTAQEGITVREGCLVEGNVVRDCASGIRVAAGSNTLVRGNDVLGNIGIGLRVDTAGNTVSENTVRGNGTNYQFAAGNQLELLISQIPQVLSWPCSAKLQGTLTGVAGQSGITIASENVTVDLGGHALVGASNADTDRAAILVVTFSGFRGVAVRNGAVRNWHSGVNVEGCSGSVVEGVIANGCLQAGFRGDYSAVLHGCTADGGAVGFSLRGGSATGCSAHNCTAGFSGYLAALENCAARVCQTGYELEGATVRGCVATGCEKFGFQVSRCTVSQCQAYESGGPGYWAQNSLLVSNNASICGVQSDTEANPGAGFVLAGGSVAEGNTAFDNLRGFVATGGRNVFVRNRAGVNAFENWSISAGNVVAPIIEAGTNGAPVIGNSYAGSYSTTHPDANITH